MLARTWAFPRSLPSRLFVEMRARRILRYLDSTRGRGNILIFLTPEHGNIGDSAIIIAEKEFFRKYFPGRTVVEIPQGLDRPVAARLGAVHGDDSVVTVPGGGFLGNLWLPANYVQKNYLENFPNRRIVLFPNTIFFEEKGGWRREIAETRAAYRAHGDLHVFIRDKSIDFLKKEILGEDSPRAHGAPDIVLSLDRSAPKFERAGVLLCFRADKEKVLPDAAVAELEARLRERGERASRTDTVVPYAVPAEVREFEVERKFDEFRRARLVITDRLHGMIFAAITGTPCIALNNSSGKVEGVWSLWLRHLDYVKFVREAAEIPALLDAMPALGGRRYDPSVFEPHWEKLAAVIHGSSFAEQTIPIFNKKRGGGNHTELLCGNVVAFPCTVHFKNTKPAGCEVPADFAEFGQFAA